MPLMNWDQSLDIGVERFQCHELLSEIHERRAAYGFRSFDDGIEACRRILRRGATPAVLRLYDAIEADRSYQTGPDLHVLLVLDEVQWAEGNLVVGGILSSVTRKMDATFEKRLAEHAELFGGDVKWTWKNRMYSFMGQYAISNVEGTAPLIASKQRSSARYFQRPDRGAGLAHGGVDQPARRVDVALRPLRVATVEVGARRRGRRGRPGETRRTRRPGCRR